MSIELVDETSSVYSAVQQVDQFNVIEGFGNVGQGDEDLVSA